eukprot:5906571-Pyramimonas_sp.AAC.1
MAERREVEQARKAISTEANKLDTKKARHDDDLMALVRHTTPTPHPGLRTLACAHDANPSPWTPHAR